jgi:hypothetical protein
VVEAAAVDLCRMQHIGHTSRAVALLPEKVHCGYDQAIARRERWILHS